MGMITFRPTSGADARPGWANVSTKPSIGACLGIAFAAVLVALLLGMRMARQSTRETAHLIGSVASQYEPCLLYTSPSPRD